MTDIQARINDLVSNFVNEITRLARAAAKDTLSSALDGTGTGTGMGMGMGTGGGGRSSSGTGSGRGRGRKASSAGTGSASRRSKGAKRPKSEIAEIQARVLSHIQSNPGQRIEQINKVLGTLTADLTLPLKKLISEGSISTKGARRATTYLPGGSAKKRRGKGK